MIRFTPNPIVVRKDNKPYRLIELDFDFQEKDFLVEIYDKQSKLILKTIVNVDTFINLDYNLGTIKMVYKDFNNSVLFEKIVNLQEKEDVLIIPEEDELISKLEAIVKNKMDYPEGTSEEIKVHTEMLKKAIIDKNARVYVMSKIRQIVASTNLVKQDELEKYVYKLYANLYGMGVLQELDDDIEVGEIMVNASVFPSFRCDIYYIKGGKKYKYNKSFRNLNELEQVFARTIEFNKKELNSIENAIVEATRENKDRVNIIIPEASENYILNIRKFSNFVPNLENMKKFGTVDDYIDKLFNVLVRGKANIGIGGEMGTGKTTLISYLLTYTEPIERKVVIASVSEIDIERVLKGHDVVILNVNEEKGFTFEKLMKASLRTTASRVIVPESRGSEFRQIYEANLKTKGNMFTAHALDDYSFLDMCVDMYLSSGMSQNENSEYIKNKLAKSIDIIVIMRKVGDKIRIKSISEVLLDEKKNFDRMNVLYEWKYDPENPLEGHYETTGNKLSDALKQRLNENGVPMSMMKDL